MFQLVKSRSTHTYICEVYFATLFAFYLHLVIYKSIYKHKLLNVNKMQKVLLFKYIYIYIEHDREGHEGYKLTCKAEIKESWYGRGTQELFISVRDFSLSVERWLL